MHDLETYLASQQEQILLGDVALRAGDAAVHDTRVAVRRLRSTLRTFAPLWQRADASRLDTELRWYAGILGEVRDREVLRRRFDESIAQLPAELVLGPVEGHIEQELLREQMAAQQVLDAAMNSDRYLALLGELDRWVDEAPFDTSARDAGRSTLSRLARNTARKAEKRLRTGLRTSDETALHRARKAAKRARYGYDVLAPHRKKARKHSKRMKKLQTILGDHQDSVVARQALRRLALRTATPPDENGFSYGLLYGREEHAAHMAVAAARKW
jgi:CHAD domain-containing protein